jgi:hypothetical protein
MLLKLSGQIMLPAAAAELHGCYIPHGNLELLGINGTRAICIKEVKSFPATPSCELASRLA